MKLIFVVMIVLGHSTIVNMLLRHGADWLSSDQNGATGLHYAAQNNFPVSMFVS